MDLSRLMDIGFELTDALFVLKGDLSRMRDVGCGVMVEGGISGQ